jgi:large subunit ribosomal protein L25
LEGGGLIIWLAEIPDLHAEVRTGTGKGAARQARREARTRYRLRWREGPAADQHQVQLSAEALKAGRFLSTLFNLKVEGQEDVRVICRGVQRDVVKDLPTHLDLMRLRRTSRVNLFIHVDFINHEASPGLKRAARADHGAPRGRAGSDWRAISPTTSRWTWAGTAA